MTANSPFADRFEYLTSLGVSNSHRTFLALDQHSGRKVVVKLWPLADVERLKERVELYCKLEVPARRPVAFGVEGYSYFLATPYLEGKTLAQRLERGPLSASETMAMARGILTDLERLHRLGLLHRDIKPTNIVLDPEGQSHLIDYGLMVHAHAAGTIPYMAPEILGIVPGRPQEHSDLYSLGLVAHECLTGQPAREGDLTQLLREHTQPVGQLPEVNSDLNAWLRKLAHPDLLERYRTAAGALHDLECLENGKPVVLGCEDRRDTLCEPAWVGRAHELATLKGLLEAPRARMALVSGPSGRGKSALLEEFVRRCIGRARTFHFNARSNPLGQFVVELQKSGVEIPPLQTLVRGADESRTPDKSDQRRLVGHLLKALEQLGGFIFLLDDYQECDDLTQALLQEWDLGRPQAASPQLFVLACREGDLEVCDGLSFDVRLPLGPLTKQQARDLIRSMGGMVEDRTLKLVSEHSEGEPLMIEGSLRGLMESGELIREGGTLKLVSESATLPSVSWRLGVKLAGRLATLSTETRRVLEVGALLGKSFEPGVVAQVCQESLEHVLQHLLEARRRHLLWIEPSGCATFVHDQILEQLCESADTFHHGGIAAALAQSHPERHLEIARHLTKQGDIDGALLQAKAATRRERSLFQMGRAAEAYRIVLQALHLGAEERQRTLKEYGFVLKVLGDLDEAIAVLESSLSLCTAPNTRLELQVLLAQVCFEAWKMPQCRKWCVQALGTLGYDLPNGRLGLARAIAKLGTQRARGRFPLHSKVEADQISICCYVLSQWALFRDQPGAALWSLLVGLNGTERQKDARFRPLLLGGYAVVLDCINQARRAENVIGQLFQLVSERDELERCNQVGIASMHYLIQGQVKKALGVLRPLTEEPHLLENFASQVVHVHAAICYYLLGDLERTRELMRLVLRLSSRKQAGDPMAVATAHRYLLLCGEKVEVAMRGQRPQLVEMVYQTSRGLERLAAGTPGEAIGFLESAASFARANTIPYLMGPVFAWLALAYRLASEHTDRLAGSARLKLLLRAEKSARDARRAAAKTTVVQAHAFRESAEVAALLGDTEAAMGYLVESKRVAEQHGMLLELAWTNWSLARIGRAVGWEVSPGLSEAELTLRQFGALIPDLPPVSRGPTPSLENRFASLVEWGPKIVRQLERNEVLDALLESLRASLQAESVFLVDGKFRVCRGEPAGGWSQSLVERAKQSDQVVRNTPTLSESQASIRSIACCRIPTESECLVVVATHRFLGGLFDEQGERALHHLTGLAGTALDNAVRYSEHVALEQEAVTTARRFRDLFEHSGIGTVVCTTKGRILLRNYFFEELLQGRPKRTQSVIYHEDRLQFLELLKRGGVGETRCQRPGGELLWVRLECIVLSGGERLLTFTDISEQRRSALADFERSEGRVLSSEIHDVIAGRLAGVSMHLQSAEVTAASDPGLATAKVRELSSPVSELVEEVDDIILDLRSEVPANFDSLPKIERELGRLGSRLTDVQLPSTPVGGMCGLCLHRTVRECVTNILRHSQCTNVTVNIDASESDIVYEISDDGVGFEPLANPQGRGLVSMTHRCEMLGGSFEVRSVPGQGTTVRATLPLPHGS